MLSNKASGVGEVNGKWKQLGDQAQKKESDLFQEYCLYWINIYMHMT